MKSISQQILLLEGLIDTTDISEWESEFLISILEKIAQGKVTSNLTEKQLAVIERIDSKHFA